MRIWKSFGSAHSAKISVIGKFKKFVPESNPYKDIVKYALKQIK